MMRRIQFALTVVWLWVFVDVYGWGDPRTVLWIVVVLFYLFWPDGYVIAKKKPDDERTEDVG